MRREAHRARGAALLAAAALLLPALGACGGDGDEDAAPATTAAGTTTEETAPEETMSAPAETTTEPDAAPENAPPFRQRPASGRSTGTTPGAGVSILSDVRLERREGFDRFVFRFQPGGLPGYEIDYVEPPITTHPGGAPMSVGGEAFLRIRLTPASGFDVAGTAEQVYTGPLRLVGADAGAQVVVDAVRTEDFEAGLTWVAGLTGRAPFRVLTREEPPRLVVDIRAE